MLDRPCWLPVKVGFADPCLFVMHLILVMPAGWLSDSPVMK